MERFIPTEISPEKSNTFQGITFFLVSPLRPKNFFYQEPGSRTRARNIACQNMAGSSNSYENVIQASYTLVKRVVFHPPCFQTSLHTTVKSQVRMMNVFKRNY